MLARRWPTWPSFVHRMAPLAHLAPWSWATASAVSVLAWIRLAHLAHLWGQQARRKQVTHTHPSAADRPPDLVAGPPTVHLDRRQEPLLMEPAPERR